jgi:hypothetical protein
VAQGIPQEKKKRNKSLKETNWLFFIFKNSFQRGRRLG